MLYYIKAKKGNLVLKAEACTTADASYGVHFMKSHQYPEDIRNMTSEECNLLIRSIIERACYETIIVSRAFGLDENLPVLLSLAGKIYITSSNCRSSLERLNKISELLPGLTGMEPETNDRICFCINSVFRTNEYFSLNNFRKIFLPDPFAEKCGFPPSDEYLSAVGNLLAGGEGDFYA